jgi:nucleoside-diphosphate-sugar epimerase
MKLPADKVHRLRGFYQGRRVLVTGGAGFIGGHLCDALVSLGAIVTVLDDLSNATLEHLAGLIEMEPERTRFVHGSILDDEAVADATDDTQTIFHLAALGSVPRSIDYPQRTWSVNATGTVRILEAARIHKVTRVVLAGSSSVYGDDPRLPRVETTLPKPLSPYAASKLAGESLLAVWARCYGFSTVSLRYFNVFGPRQNPNSTYAAVIPAFAKKLIAGEAPTIFGDGSQSRDFTFVADAVLATLLAGASQSVLTGEVLNVGTGRATTVAQLAALMIERSEHRSLRPVFEPGRAGDVAHSLADFTRARDLIGYEPTTSLEAGLEETMHWYRQVLSRT